MLAVKLEMSDKLPKLEEGKKTSSYSSAANASPTAKMLDEWEERASSTIGNEPLFFIFSFLPTFLQLVFQPLMSAQIGFIIGAPQPSGLNY